MGSYEDLKNYEEAFTQACEVQDEPDGIVEDFLAEPEVQRQLMNCVWNGIKRMVRWLMKRF